MCHSSTMWQQNGKLKLLFTTAFWGNSHLDYKHIILYIVLLYQTSQQSSKTSFALPPFSYGFPVFSFPTFDSDF